jgi:predicted metalloprotease with PDZ domain
MRRSTMGRKVAAAALLFLLAACGASAAPRQDMEKEKTTRGKQGWLGVAIQDVTPRMAREKELPVKSGALVNDVTEESPAEKAGIKEDDVIVQFNGTNVDESDDLRTAVRSAAPGEQAAVTLFRGKEKKTLQVTLGSAPRRDEVFSFHGPGRIIVPRMPRIPRIHMFRTDELLGLTLSDLNRQLGEYFGAPEGKGVLVQEVEPKSAGDRGGFKAGDVIVTAGKKDVESIEDVGDALAGVREGEKVEFGILRKGAHVTLTAESEGDRGERWNRFRSFRFHGDGHPGFEREGLRREMDMLRDRLRSFTVYVRYLGDRLTGASS